VLRCRSDDGIKIWLNGRVVHVNDVHRGVDWAVDEVPVYLEAGINRLLVKVDNYTGSWGFQVVVPKANF